MFVALNCIGHKTHIITYYICDMVESLFKQYNDFAYRVSLTPLIWYKWFLFFLLKRRGLFNIYMNAYQIYKFSLLNPESMLSTNYLHLNFFKATVTSWELCNCLIFHLDAHLSTQSIVTCLCEPILIQLLNEKFEESPGNNVTDM